MSRPYVGPGALPSMPRTLHVEDPPCRLCQGSAGLEVSQPDQVGTPACWGLHRAPQNPCVEVLAPRTYECDLRM